MDYAFDPGPIPSLRTDDSLLYPVRRIFCVGRNYADHAREMGHAPERGAPFYFTKSPHHLTQAETVAFPTETRDYHHEVELAVLIGAPVHKVAEADAMDAVWGYACALDMTRRDLQAVAKDKRRPWELGKDVEASAVFGPVSRAFVPTDQRITLSVNGTVTQSARISDMIHSVSEIISDLSRFYHLGQGDVIMTGTPAGVGPVRPGDQLKGKIDGLSPLKVTFAD